MELSKHQQQYPELKQLIYQVLAQDPRPAYKKNKVDQKIYGMSLYDLNITWQLSGLKQVEVLGINKQVELSTK